MISQLAKGNSSHSATFYTGPDRPHSNLLGPLDYSNQQADSLVVYVTSFDLVRQSHSYHHQHSKPLANNFNYLGYKTEILSYHVLLANTFLVLLLLKNATPEASKRMIFGSGCYSHLTLWVVTIWSCFHYKHLPRVPYNPRGQTAVEHAHLVKTQLRK